MILIEIALGLVLGVLILYGGAVLVSKMDERFRIGAKLKKWFGMDE